MTLLDARSFRACLTHTLLALALTACDKGNPNAVTTGGTTSTGGATGAGATTGSGGAAAGSGGSGATSATSGGTTSDGGATGGNGAATATGGSGGGGFQGTMRIMPLGDSITRATCYRAELWKSLNESYSGRFDLVGTLTSDSGCGVPGYDQDNQGYGSALVTETVAGTAGPRECQPNCPDMTELGSAFSTATPDVVLLHFATNDVWNGKAPADILAAYKTVIDALRVAHPKVILLVAQIVPLNPTDYACAECPARVEALNTEIATWAPGVSTADSPVIVVDQWTGFDVAADTKDGVHPNASGSEKMAAQWFAALQSLF